MWLGPRPVVVHGQDMHVNPQPSPQPSSASPATTSSAAATATECVPLPRGTSEAEGQRQATVAAVAAGVAGSNCVSFSLPVFLHMQTPEGMQGCSQCLADCGALAACTVTTRLIVCQSTGLQSLMKERSCLVRNDDPLSGNTCVHTPLVCNFHSSAMPRARCSL